MQLVQVALVVCGVGFAACAGKSQRADHDADPPPVGADAGSGGSTLLPPEDLPNDVPPVMGGSTAGGAGPGASGGMCSAVCIPRVQLAVSGVSLDEVRSSSFEACRNDECYRGAFSGPGGNQIELAGRGFGATNVTLSYFGDATIEMRLAWSLAPSSTPIDGDRYRLTAFAPSGRALTLIDAAVTYEHYAHCSGPCARAELLDLERVDDGGGGFGAAGAASAD